MMVSRIAASLLFSALIAVSAQAQDRFLTAIAAHGLEELLTPRTLSMTGTVTDRLGNEESFTVTAETGGRLRIDYGTPPRRSLFRTTQGVVIVENGELQPKPGHVGQYGELDFLSILGLEQLSRLNSSREQLPPRTVYGRTTSPVRARSGRSASFYGITVEDDAIVDFDAETGLVTSITRLDRADKSVDFAFDVSHIFLDYRRVEDVLLPFHIERWVRGIRAETFVINSIQFNPVIATSLDPEGAR